MLLCFCWFQDWLEMNQVSQTLRILHLFPAVKYPWNTTTVKKPAMIITSEEQVMKLKGIDQRWLYAHVAVLEARKNNYILWKGCGCVLVL